MTRRSYTSASRKQTSGKQLDFSFELDGVVFKNEGDVSLMDLSEFARLATQGVDSESPEGAAIVAEIFMTLLGERTYQRFRTHCRRHSTDDETLMAILGDLMSEAGDRPTSRPSDSSDGPPSAPATAMAVSFSRGTVEQVEAPKEEQQLVSYG
ncbi:hypothetical protein [Streptosporangium roseum]|uniref:hypothetical protein n=1 Tax=Streptosporangium roseum TaxID=2001 RepID=UPI0004CDBF37|nr:hypothetical protein [Streptosporangium roseum]